MSSWVSYFFVALTVLFTVSGQIAIKWAVIHAGGMPVDNFERVRFVGRLLLNGWVIFGLSSAFIASIAWILAMTRLPLSHAYPFIGASFIFITVLSNLVFSEPITVLKLTGVGLIFLGIVVASQG